ncbi:ubiquitin-like with PHD and RING finger domains 2 [Entomophthora muscae]|uniref:Ubiquitin-like with PHD and RING finger domains 2 n=1 Tax=Entomophthora muscae TaxID=34485 RepID=A0ACC2SWG9_9FUNG|nr:ubiquitin-like with PHD and RING finger domains 2 [Entomophthora muscae]
MRCNVRGPDGSKFPLVIDRLDKVRDIRQTIAKELKLKATQVRLIYLGKQLEDSLSFYDYDVKDNDTILAFERVNVADLPAFESPTEPSGALPTPSSDSQAETQSSEAPTSMSEADQVAILAAQEEAEKCKNATTLLIQSVKNAVATFVARRMMRL